MFEKLVWRDDRVLMGDIVLRKEHSRSDDWDLGERCLRFYKTKELVEQYERFFATRPRFRANHVLEIGIWDGGSTAFWNEHLRPQKLVALDIADRDDSTYFREFVVSRQLQERVKTFWRIDQADAAALRALVQHELGGVLDLVIDDASHLYSPTRASFEVLFPLLPPGGLYIIEDWAWEHWPECHGSDHPFANLDGLSTLVREFVEATGSSKTLIASVSVFEGFVVVERGPRPQTELRLTDEIVRRPLRSPGLPETVNAIAFYLPQYHPIPENDRWWGKGYTEWAKVARGRPRFAGHYQPHLPERLGFYDLRLPATRAAQATLAREHGIHGFCYYHYWFGGRRLLERPFAEVLASGQPDFPFCVCWANENWTRRWDGGEQTVLVQQNYSADDDCAFIEHLLPAFRDARYIRVQGAPLLLVYRAGALPDALATTERWRDVCRKNGIPRLHLVAAMTFELTDPRPLGFDAGVEFPPHGLPGNAQCRVDAVDHHFRGGIVSFPREVDRRLAEPRAPFRLYRTAMSGWDNSARRGDHATIFHDASPQAYERWLRGIVTQAASHPLEERMVFINAWNEWGEGAHLEPDQRFGLGYLQATKRVMTPRASIVEHDRVQPRSTDSASQ
jgi:hypothetical protein